MRVVQQMGCNGPVEWLLGPLEHTGLFKTPAEYDRAMRFAAKHGRFPCVMIPVFAEGPPTDNTSEGWLE